jgi:endonuclease YncB( thermonuclease family)
MKVVVIMRSVARDLLSEVAKGKAVSAIVQGGDRCGRVLADLEVAGQAVNKTMVADGLAWHYVEYSKDAGLARAEREARAAGRSRWADKAPVAPWEWRAGEKGR